MTKRHYILTKESIYQEDIIIIYTSNRALTYMKQKLGKLKEAMSSSRLIVGDLHMPLTIIDKITRQNFNKEKRELEQYYRPTRPKRHIQNIAHIFLKCTWNILQIRIYIRSQNGS